MSSDRKPIRTLYARMEKTETGHKATALLSDTVNLQAEGETPEQAIERLTKVVTDHLDVDLSDPSVTVKFQFEW